jgi:hypothetical protein
MKMANENEKQEEKDLEKPVTNPQNAGVTKKQSFNNDSASIVPGNKQKEEEEEAKNNKNKTGENSNA